MMWIITDTSIMYSTNNPSEIADMSMLYGLNCDATAMLNINMKIIPSSKVFGNSRIFFENDAIIDNVVIVRMITSSLSFPVPVSWSPTIPRL